MPSRAFHFRDRRRGDAPPRARRRAAIDMSAAPPGGCACSCLAPRRAAGRTRGLLDSASRRPSMSRSAVIGWRLVPQVDQVKLIVGFTAQQHALASRLLHLLESARTIAAGQEHQHAQDARRARARSRRSSDTGPGRNTRRRATDRARWRAAASRGCACRRAPPRDIGRGVLGAARVCRRRRRDRTTLPPASARARPTLRSRRSRH